MIYFQISILLSVSVIFKEHYMLNPAQVTSKHKHFCCPCPKLADFVYSLILA